MSRYLVTVELNNELEEKYELYYDDPDDAMDDALDAATDDVSIDEIHTSENLWVVGTTLFDVSLTLAGSRETTTIQVETDLSFIANDKIEEIVRDEVRQNYLEVVDIEESEE